jgi:Leucine Rich repeat
LEKKLKDLEQANLASRKKIARLNNELDQKDKIIGQANEENKENSEKIETYNLLILRIYNFIENIYGRTPIKVINLQYMNLDDNMVQTIGKIIESNPSIETVNLEGNNITDKGVACFIDSISEGNLNTLNLSFNKITPQGAWDLLKAFQKREDTISKGIKKIDLSYNYFEEKELYIKVWEEIKPIRANYSIIKTKKKDLIEARGTILKKIFKTLCDKMFDSKEIKQIMYILDKFEIKQGSEEEIVSISLRNRNNIYDCFKTEYENVNYKAFKLRVSRLSTKKIRLRNLEEPRDLDIMLLMAQRPAFILSYIKKLLKAGLKIDTIDKNLDETLLMYAARTNNLNLCKLLISKLADLDVKNVIFP